MKKSTRLFITGSVQGMFFRQYIKEHADKNFLKGDTENIDNMVQICKRGPRHANIRSVEEKQENFQDFKEFKILRI